MLGTDSQGAATEFVVFVLHLDVGTATAGMSADRMLAALIRDLTGVDEEPLPCGVKDDVDSTFPHARADMSILGSRVRPPPRVAGVGDHRELVPPEESVVSILAPDGRDTAALCELTDSRPAHSEHLGCLPGRRPVRVRTRSASQRQSGEKDLLDGVPVESSAGVLHSLRDDAGADHLVHRLGRDIKDSRCFLRSSPGIGSAVMERSLGRHDGRGEGSVDRRDDTSGLCTGRSASLHGDLRAVAMARGPTLGTEGVLSMRRTTGIMSAMVLVGSAFTMGASPATDRWRRVRDD